MAEEIDRAAEEIDRAAEESGKTAEENGKTSEEKSGGKTHMTRTKGGRRRCTN